MSGSTRGLSAAAHCPDNGLRYVDTSNTLTYRAAHQAVWGDVQWHTTATYVSDDFYYNFGALRDTAAVSFANPGARLCRFGKTTGAHCNYVLYLNRCLNGACHLTQAEINTAEPGDSGGPWYYGGTAYGIHTGEVEGRDVFTPTTYFDEAIAGLRVATT